ncbi:MAG: pantoate--beta-alanine ligase [Bacteroidales bacterium]|jgi:pantoate--beta-alanine ligase|nr:pantoate--beta-alanine ligase [Bacteroidales bacterium]NPV36938.1 pantoate--beta-alanine ligase [Bacteroidales bacterium]
MQKIIRTRAEAADFAASVRFSGKTMGFVPTMGALHEGHLSLVRKALQENDYCVTSIFVNPIQFNNREDLEKYPRTPERDLQMLEEAGCQAVFMPSVDEMYPEEVNEHYDFGHLDKVMEGAFRPGHFNGVAIVVKRLFEIIQPHKAYFGEKDYQQLAIIRELVRRYQIPVKIVACPIVREDDGLAMSSRNMRLSAEDRRKAPQIYQTLLTARQLAKEHDVAFVKNWVLETLKSIEGFEPEYFEIASGETLLPVNHWDEADTVMGFVVVWLGGVRLIDNIELRRK